MNLNELLSGYLSFTGRPAATLTATEYIEFYKLFQLTSGTSTNNLETVSQKPFCQNVSAKGQDKDDTVVDKKMYEKDTGIEVQNMGIQSISSFSEQENIGKEELTLPVEKPVVREQLANDSQKQAQPVSQKPTQKKQADALAILRSVSG